MSRPKRRFAPKDNWNTMFIKMLSAKPLGYNVVLAEISGSVSAALLMSRLLYLWEKGSVEGYIYKTAKEMKKETGLTGSQQKTAIKKWKELGVLEVERKDIPGKRHYKIKMPELFGVISQHSGIDLDSMSEFAKKYFENYRKKDAE